MFFSKSKYHYDYALDGNFYRIVIYPNKAVLKKLYFNCFYWVMEVFSTLDAATMALYKKHSIKVCYNCNSQLILDQFGTYCPNEKCDCMASNNYPYAIPKRIPRGPKPV